ncbi:MAG: GIY-YIG nuclease family protein [Candidatus Peribacteraceae bacterium]|nr:GIY-YIG nuclease family protein [Candidatus Peribacteraceae bacterium]
MERYFVYLLRCSDGTFYVGITNDVEKRVAQHQEGWDPKAYTHHRRPVTLVYKAEFSEGTDAIAFEKQVKGWGREKKEALIRGEYEKLPRLAMNSEKKRRLMKQDKDVSP